MGLGNRLEELDAMLGLIEMTHDKILVLLESAPYLTVAYYDTQMFLYIETPTDRDFVCAVAYGDKTPVQNTLDDIEDMFKIARLHIENYGGTE